MRRLRRWVTHNIILLGIVIYVYWDYMKYVLAIIILMLAIQLVMKLAQRVRTTALNLHMQDVDMMDGITFEYYVAQLLIDLGYANVSLTEKYDYGVDIIAEKDGIRWGIQTKRHSGLVKAAAVRQVVTGLRLYDCDRAMVIANSSFSNVARRLADGNDCVLVDRAELHALTS